MNWQRELEARLADDPRLERKKSRQVEGEAFFFKGKEIANFTAPASVNIRLSAAVIFALGPLAAEECVQEVSKKGIVVRLESEQDLEFAQLILERVFHEKAGERRPEGKNAKPGGWSAKRKATQYLEDAKALKALRELDPEAKE
jgi:hypothetical protein